MLNLRLAAVAVMSVAFVALTLAYAPRPEAQTAPSISISASPRTIDEGDSTTVTVKTANLRLGYTYLIRLSAGSNLGFNSSCSDKDNLLGRSGGRATVHGCTDPGGTITARLDETNPDSGTDSVTRAIVATDYVSITVEADDIVPQRYQRPTVRLQSR